MEISVIQERPPGRLPVETVTYFDDEQGHAAMVQAVLKEVEAGTCCACHQPSGASKHTLCICGACILWFKPGRSMCVATLVFVFYVARRYMYAMCVGMCVHVRV